MTAICNCRSDAGEGDCEACRAVGASMVAWWLHLVRSHGIEACAAATGLLGSFLLAAHGEHAAWGWWAFLASNAGWILFAWMRRHWFLLLQQAGFTLSSVWGIWNWVFGQ